MVPESSKSVENWPRCQRNKIDPLQGFLAKTACHSPLKRRDKANPPVTGDTRGTRDTVTSIGVAIIIILPYNFVHQFLNIFPRSPPILMILVSFLSPESGLQDGNALSA